MLLVQSIGFIGFFIAVYSFQIDNRKKLLLFQMAAGIAFSIHFLLLHSVVAGILNIIGALRNYTFSQKERFSDKTMKIFFCVFLFLFALVTYVTWNNAYNILPFFGMTISTVIFFQSTPKRIRFLSLMSPPFWFSYNFIVGSYPGMATEIFIFSSSIIAILRFDVFKATVLKPGLAEQETVS